MFKSNQTRYAVSPGCVECKIKRIFGIACLGKKLVFHTEICDYFKFLFFKYSIFRRVKELFKSNQTRYAVSPGCVKCKTNRIFGIACLGKKLVFHTEICDYFKFLFFKYSIFRRVKELFKSNQTRYAVSPGCVECKTKRIFGIACLEKKFVSQSEISTFSLILFSKIEKIYRVKELFKVNQIDIPDYQYYLGCNAKTMVGLTVLEKKFVSQSEISTFSLILFSKIEKIYRVKDFFKANQIDIPDYQYYLGCNAKRMVGLTVLEKKFVSQSEISTFSLILFSKI